MADKTNEARARKVIARAWKDEEFRNGLPQEVRDKLPAAPEGAARMSDEELEAAAGGGTPLVAAGAAALVGAGYGFSEITD